MSVLDVSKYILEKMGDMTSMKLQKLCYYSQAWSLVWDERPLFEERIEAWANGPVCPKLYREHKGQFSVRARTLNTDSHNLDTDAKDTIDAVLETYGDKPAHWLSDLTHREPPWIDAREGLSDGERGDRVISHGAMADFYGNL